MSFKKDKERDLKSLLKEWVEKGNKGKTKENQELNVDIVSSVVREAVSLKEINILQLKKIINEVRNEELMPYAHWEGFEERQKRFNALKSKLREMNIQI